MEPGPLLLEAFEAGRGDEDRGGKEAGQEEGGLPQDVPLGAGGGDQTAMNAVQSIQALISLCAYLDG